MKLNTNHNQSYAMLFNLRFEIRYEYKCCWAGATSFFAIFFFVSIKGQSFYLDLMNYGQISVESQRYRENIPTILITLESLLRHYSRSHENNMISASLSHSGHIWKKSESGISNLFSSWHPQRSCSAPNSLMRRFKIFSIFVFYFIASTTSSYHVKTYFLSVEMSEKWTQPIVWVFCFIVVCMSTCTGNGMIIVYRTMWQRPIDSSPQYNLECPRVLW